MLEDNGKMVLIVWISKQDQIGRRRVGIISSKLFNRVYLLHTNYLIKLSAQKKKPDSITYITFY